MTDQALTKSEPTEVLGDRFNALIQEFLKSIDVKQNSKRTYERALRQFIRWIAKEKKTNPNREDILAYKHHLETRGLSSFTLSSYLVVVRKFFEWAEGMKLYPNIAKGIKGAKRSRGFKKDPLTLEQIKLLLTSLDKNSLESKRDYAILNLLIRTGLRAIEVVRANVGDIRQESGEAILWIFGKGRDNKDEFAVLTEATLSPIREYLNERGNLKEDDPLFASVSDRNKNGRLTSRSVSRIVKKHLRKVSINNGRISAHSLRHTAITILLQHGKGTIQEAQLLGRHANINTTLIYAHNINRVENAPERKIDDALRGILDQREEAQP
ncbi:MAG: tyrosine-type recombinase/integrase [Chlamydiae bacterium]|nr:tyrosine-type recombinase/integrase [Chlamydiota bacterium]